MPIDYAPNVASVAEQHNAIEEFISADGNITQKVTVRCKWEDRYAVAFDTVSVARQWPQNNIGTVCNGARIKPVPGKFTQDGQAIVYEEALIDLTYNYFQGRKLSGTDPVSGKTITYTDTLEVIAESQPLKFSNLTWGSATGDRLTEKETPPLQYNRLKFFRTIFGLPQIDPSALDLVQSSNDAAYESQSLGLSFPIETLSFIPPQISNSVTQEGSSGYTCKVGFDYRPNTWNRFWRTKTQAYEIIWGANGQQFKPYPPKSYARWLF